ncbi:winged helix DNA-binding domain-containing protein [Streptomyces sp. BI20]|uniref:winged helix DNA-binding domain-containing protein n=1 Tax=Streptomyces sp. BI20 TaxID=3403460 RepID=UPI003C774FDB
MERGTAERVARAAAQAVGGQVREEGVEGVLARVFAVQAQDLPAAELGLRVRSTGLTRAAVHRALDTDRTLLRGWFMRGTLHLVPAADARWLLALYGPAQLALAARRLRELDLSPELCERSEELMARAIADEGPLTRAELTARLGALGVPGTGQAAFHLIRRAALTGRICHGPLRAGEPAFALLDAWLPPAGPPAFTGAAAHRELARRYRIGHGPADAADFAHWSGLRTGEAKEAWAASARDHTDPGPAPAPDPDAPDVRLLPAYDDHLVAYRTREPTVPAAHEKRVWPGGGMIRATVLVDGLAVGTWTRGGGAGAAPRIEPFPDTAPLTPAATAALTREAEAAAAFTG